MRTETYMRASMLLYHRARYFHERAQRLQDAATLYDKHARTYCEAQSWQCLQRAYMIQDHALNRPASGQSWDGAVKWSAAPARGSFPGYGSLSAP